MAEQQNQSDFISLQSLKIFIKQLFQLFFRSLDFLGYALKKNIIAILIFTIAGLGVGYLYYLVWPSYYNVEMIVLNNDLPRRTYGEIITNLNSLTTGQSQAKLANELNIPESSARNIVFIEGKTLSDEPLSKDTSSKTGQPFKVTAKLNTSTVADTLQQALINYFNSNPYIKRIKEGQHRIYDEKLLFIESELRKLDSLKDSYNSFLLSSRASATFYNNALDPAAIYTQSNNLANQREAIQKWKNDASSAVLLVDSFKSTTRPQAVYLRPVLILGILCGLIFGIFWAILATLSKKIGSL
jgi:hypothetical protein